MSAEQALAIVQDVIVERNASILTRGVSPAHGLDSLVTAVDVLARAVIALERTVASRTEHLA